jgi:catechol 2,3-dioxygenase-like lactoylglutathione lyase family enzyme
MNARWLALLLVLCVAGAAVPAFAQVRPANEMGVAAGHEHLRSMDVEGARKFWLALGGEPAALGMTQLIKFPGVFFMFQNAAAANRGAAAATPPAPPQPSEGSTVDSIGFKVKNLKESLAKWEAAGIKPLPGATARQAFLMAPDNVRVQITEDPSISTAIATDELKMVVPNVNEASDWYAKFFGARVSKQAGGVIAQIPGMNIRFVAANQPAAGTQGRAIDHIGLEVKNLEPFMKKLEAAGVKVNRPYAAAPAQLAPLKSLAFITDPWGTYIELNEGFADVK